MEMRKTKLNKAPLLLIGDTLASKSNLIKIFFKLKSTNQLK